MRKSLVLLALLLSACGEVKVWNPFGDSKPQENTGAPKNAVEYQCEAGKKFYLRMLDNGASVWLILPEREVALSKTAGTKYSNGITTLEINGEDATLQDGNAKAYSGCKAAAKAK